MREIKFRAWNKRIGWKDKDGSPCEPKMEYSGFIIFPNTGLANFPESGWDINGQNEDPENFILMQYTGLKDKNKLTEIYENDIIDIEGNIIGNIYEMDKKETDIVIQDFGGENWFETYNEAISRGCRHA